MLYRKSGADRVNALVVVVVATATFLIQVCNISDNGPKFGVSDFFAALKPAEDEQAHPTSFTVAQHDESWELMLLRLP